MNHKRKIRKRLSPVEPEYAPGNYDLLEEEASRAEKTEGAATRVTRLSFDEVDPD